MSIPGAASPLFIGAAAEEAAFQIDRSLRFNSGDSAYLNRTPSSAGNRRTWTWSGWIKRTAINNGANVRHWIFIGGNTASDTGIGFIGFKFNDDLLIGSNNTDFLLTTRKFRDLSAWYHIVVAFDSTQATASNRIKVYVNGVEETDFSTDNRSSVTQNGEYGWNRAERHTIGSVQNYAGNTPQYIDAYMAEANFVDGQALAPTDFGEYDTNNVWQAKDTSGLTFGTNGFRLKFADNSSDAALGTDSSGNSNTWTVNNLTVGGAVNPTAKQNFDAVTYTGNGSTQSISSFAFQPDFVWIKIRGQSFNHNLFNSVSGPTKHLSSNLTNSEYTESSGRGLTAFNSDGFSLGQDVQGPGSVNASGQTYVAWGWKAGGAAVSNTDGTITSSVSANTSYGFSVVTYTGSNSVSTVGHGLGNTPGMYVVKRRTDSGYGWIVYHSAMGASNMMALQNTSGAALDFDPWNQTSPTNSVFTVNTTGSGTVNAASKDYVAYVWSEIAGFSKFSSYTGNGSGTGPVITGLGFRPKFVIIKESSSAGQSWQLHDDTRGGNKNLQANSSAAEFTFTSVEFNDDGFSIKTSDNGWNRSGGTYIYAAFAATNLDQPGIDSLVDTPTNTAEPADTGVGGEIIGNYCTWNPLTTTTSMLFDGNLLSRFTSGQWKSALGTIGISSGKWYWENQLRDAGLGHMYGIALPTAAADSHNTDIFGVYAHDGTTFASGAQGQSYTSGFSPGDIIGVALDLTPGGTSGTLTYYKNGVSLGVAFSALDCSKTYFPWVLENGNTSDGGTNTNFGQRGFVYTAPSNHKALNSANLPTPTIPDGRQYFDTKLYTGNGGTNAQTGLGFSPDFLWLKRRNGANAHALFDQIRGVTKALESSNTGAEKTNDPAIGSFGSNGFTLTGSSNQTNASGQPYVGWAWDAGTSTVTNNDGSIASQVRAQPSAGFSIVEATAGGAYGMMSIGHGLNDKPSIVITKRTNGAGDWLVHTDVTGSIQQLELNKTDAAVAGGSYYSVNSTTFSLYHGHFTDNGHELINYCFAPVEGYSAFGSYTGNGSADGPFVHTGMRPKFLLWKNTSGVANWYIYDSARSTYNVVNLNLEPNTSDAENTLTSMNVDFLSNGYKIRGSDGDINGSGSTYVYAAFAENPFQANGGLAR